MEILITKDEIINNFDWGKFCRAVEKDFDVSKNDSYKLTFEQAKRSGIIKNQDLKFQTIYKNKIITDGYIDINDALEDIEKYASNSNLDSNGLSIEVLIERDFIRQNGSLDTRLTLEEVCSEFLNTEQEKNKKQVEELKDLVVRMNNIFKKDTL